MSARAASPRKPNIVVILTDDQGYGDLGCYGSKTIKTPRIDRMADEGMRFTSFYAAAPICTPTRAALMTGCYAPRVGLSTPLHTPDRIGLHPDEITLAEVLKSEGYATGCVGKWHLGHDPAFYPTRHGFDSYYGTPMGHFFLDINREDERTDLFLRNETEIPFPPVETITETFTEEALAFVRRNQDRPFFLFLSHTMPHEPLAVSDRFRGESEGGLYGDVIECLDWSTGQILDCIRELGLENDTYVFFTSDNGPKKGHGSSGPFRDGKHSAYEGGFRVPCVVWAPGRIPPGRTCSEVATTMDFYPTFVALAGASLPDDRVVDGKDIRPLIHGEPGAESPHDAFYYFIRHGRIAGLRVGRWKLLIDVETGPWSHRGTALYDLETDPGETKSLADERPEIVQRLRKRLETFVADLRQHSREPGRL